METMSVDFLIYLALAYLTVKVSEQQVNKMLRARLWTS